MNRTLTAWLSLLVLCFSSLPTAAVADFFGVGANSFDIEFVTIGDPGNAPDENPNPAGAVPYSYRIGKYEISEEMIDKANAFGDLGITKDTRGPDKPATSVTWYEAARFVNWLNTSTGHMPAYKFDAGGNFQLWNPNDPGYDATNLYRNKMATYFLPSLNEWHKAAYYDPAIGSYYDYPTGSDTIPDGIDFVGDPDFEAVFFDGASNAEPNIVTDIGLLSTYGTAGQGGNVFEWEETASDRFNDEANEHRSVFGGSWKTAANVLSAQHTGAGVGPAFQGDSLGIRVASVIPEPTSLSLAAIALVGLYAPRRLNRDWTQRSY
jgi:formylglycine-generating enzyme required for sulfatase activity